MQPGPKGPGLHACQRVRPCEREAMRRRARASASVRGGGGAPPPVNKRSAEACKIPLMLRIRRPLLIIVLVAIVHGLFFIWYQRPDWNTEWTDQEGYRRLGEVLASTGKFTRYPDSPTFIPEVIRTPGY